MRGILIDACNKTVRNITWSGTLAEIQSYLGCRTIQGLGLYYTRALGLPDGHMMYVDDEARLTGRVHGFFLPGVSEPIIGSCLISGDDTQGGEADVDGRVQPSRLSVVWYEGECPDE